MIDYEIDNERQIQEGRALFEQTRVIAEQLLWYSLGSLQVGGRLDSQE